MRPFLDAAVEYAGLLALVYAAHLAAYFAMGAALSAIHRRNPERRIQKSRFGEERRGVEIRHSLVSTLVTSASLAFGLFAQARHWTMLPVELGWWNALPLFLLCMVLFDAWFYAAHRLLHTRPLLRFHGLHHRSIAPTAWSTYADRPVDTLMCQGFYAVAPFLVPFPALILIAHRAFDHVNGTLGHCGFEYFASRVARWPSPLLCTTYHDQHHSEFRYNYANYFSWLDRLFGTIHPGYDRAVAEIEANAPPFRLSARTRAATRS